MSFNDSAHSADFSTVENKLIRYFPFVFLSILVVTKIFSKKIYWYVMAMEDGPVEYLTALVYLVASAVMVRIIFSLRRLNQPKGLIIIASLFAAVYFFIGMEEISWGQRIFGVQTPEAIAQYNQQGEITIHNLLSRYPLHMAYILVSLYGAFAHKFFPSRLKERIPVTSQFLIPDSKLFWYFMPAALLYLYYDYISVILVKGLGWTVFAWQTGIQGWIISKDQEPIEFLLSLGFLVFSWLLYQRISHHRLKLVPNPPPKG